MPQVKLSAPAIINLQYLRCDFRVTSPWFHVWHTNHCHRRRTHRISYRYSAGTLACEHTHDAEKPIRRNDVSRFNWNVNHTHIMYMPNVRAHVGMCGMHIVSWIILAYEKLHNNYYAPILHTPHHRRVHAPNTFPPVLGQHNNTHAFTCIGCDCCQRKRKAMRAQLWTSIFRVAARLRRESRPCCPRAVQMPVCVWVCRFVLLDRTRAATVSMCVCCAFWTAS